MVVPTEKRLLWHPRLDDKFLVGGVSQITLYQWKSDSSEIKHVASKQDLTLMKCLAWSPDPAYEDLVAVGFGSGRVDLMRLEATSATRNQSLSSGPMVTLPVRNTRSCHALAFAPADPNYLAVGLDKVRGDASLVIWDLQTAHAILSIRNSSTQTSPDLTRVSAPQTPFIRPQPAIPRGELVPRSDSRILQQQASAEIVSALSFLPQSPTVLLAGISHRWLRLFDFRLPTPIVTSVASKVHGISVDPWDMYRVGCIGDGTAMIWDVRRLTNPLLTFTERDASADGARVRVGSVLTTMEFSPVRRGLLGTLEREGSYVRFWDLTKVQVEDGRTLDRSRSRDSSQSGRAMRLSWANPLPWGSATGGGGIPASTAPSENHKLPYNLVLSDTRRTKLFSRSLSSFAFVPSNDQSHLTTNTMLVTAQGDLELYALHDTPTHTPWSARGDLALGIGRGYHVVPGTKEQKPITEPWDIAILGKSNLTEDEDEEASQALATSQTSLDSKTGGSRNSIGPSFGRGDEDGFPALISQQSASQPHTTTPNSPVPSRPPVDGPATHPRSHRRRGYSPSELRALSKASRGASPATRRDTASGKWKISKGRERRERARDREKRRDGERSVSAGDERRARDRQASASKSRVPKNLAISGSVEGDISMVMRTRVGKGYGLGSALHNAAIVQEMEGQSTLAEVWYWIHYTQKLSQSLDLSTPNYQGILTIWEIPRTTPSTPAKRPHHIGEYEPAFTPRPPHRSGSGQALGLTFDPHGPPTSAVSSLLMDPRHRSLSRPGHGNSGRRRSRPPLSAVSDVPSALAYVQTQTQDEAKDDLRGAFAALGLGTASAPHTKGGSMGESEAKWTPVVPTSRLKQRQTALQLCGWSLVEKDIADSVKRWEKEGRTSKAVCWLVFIGKFRKAVEVLMRSKDESHHMMSGMLAALIPSSSTHGRTHSRPPNPSLREHCERLVIRLQDPYLRTLLTYLILGLDDSDSDAWDWGEILQEDALPLRERLAIALHFLPDKELGAFFRRMADRCIGIGELEGLLLTGLTHGGKGMDLLQSWLDVSGDVQSVAIFASLNPFIPESTISMGTGSATVKGTRAEIWRDAYRDLLDQWRLFHHRCQFDIDHGRILDEVTSNRKMESSNLSSGAQTPFEREWTPPQVILRCNYCNKPLSPAGSTSIRATGCIHCGRPLPRCSICLMTLSIVRDTSRNAELAHLHSPKDTIDEALVFCQTCRHGGHASHILDWFYDEDGNRSHESCPVASCQCRCADGL